MSGATTKTILSLFRELGQAMEVVEAVEQQVELLCGCGDEACVESALRDSLVAALHTPTL